MSNLNLAQAFISLSRFADAKDICEQALRQNLDAADFHQYLYRIAFVGEDLVAMQEQLDWAWGKSGEFDEQGNEVRIDYRRMMKIVVDAGYKGHVGIEYSGNKLSEPDGIQATKRLLEKIRTELS